MKIRLPFAGVFFLLLLLAGYAGLTTLQVDTHINDKLLHLVTFFALTVAFYWIIDTNRRRTLNLTLVVCTLGLGVGSEFLQALAPLGRVFDILDLVANVVGSLVGLGLCSWYHKRMLERKRLRKHYNAVPGEDLGEEDLELGEGVAVSTGDHEEGVTAAGPTSATGVRTTSLEHEVDNWDENAVDNWDDDDLGGDIGISSVGAGKDVEANVGDHGGSKKRAD
ncbi:hypothetical protein B0T26DRAFT_716376 [Lasiosphaeria miniovina]|uniref:VanZ-like domain-containing protein n=1 Tax=Lasiosphaeria miniovina TaxID=1954250 RepID=A0AA40AC14_9PEZI|nr:uncharacterized protein B0T26DRAFT_716376 [Lasiosphaeria miniovina]KAK0713093.1 hypothetical protein B0T26DRAFT_716376 [Lasiosphaeria miniovina]